MYQLENKQVYNETVTLDDLRLVIQVMGEVLVNYKLFSVCFFTTTLIVCLGRATHSYITLSGELLGLLRNPSARTRVAVCPVLSIWKCAGQQDVRCGSPTSAQPPPGNRLLDRSFLSTRTSAVYSAIFGLIASLKSSCPQS